MSTVGESLGLARDDARMLTLQTVFGAAKMALSSSDPPGTLRQRVTSPGGTTERALEVLEDGGIRALFADAIGGACERSIELGKVNEDDG